MKQLKICIIGSGSTYSPELIDGFIIREGKLKVKEFALMDISMDRLKIVGGLIKRMCENFSEKPNVVLTTDLEEAIKDADYVITQFRVGLLSARVKDELIPLKYGYIGQETTGPGGFAKALRTIPEVLKITKCMEKLAPNAMLINFTNPSGIITEAVSRFSNVPCVGLCNGPISTFKKICEVFELDEDNVIFDYFGLNHLGFIKGIYIDGVNCTEEYIDKILDSPKCEHMLGYQFNKAYAKAMNILPVTYLKYYLHQKEMLEELVNQNESRAQKLLELDKKLLEQYNDKSLNTKPEGLSQRGGAWYSEAAVALINSLENNDGKIHFINIKNNGVLPELDSDAVIESPAIVNGKDIRPLYVGKLPEGIKGLVSHVKAYETLTVKAAALQSKDLALVALMSHPFLKSASDAELLLNEIISAHPEYIHLN